MKKIIKNTLLVCLSVSICYIAVTADYSSLTKNTGDTLTAQSWNQLVDNVKGIQTDGDGNVGIEGTLSTTGIIRIDQSAVSEYSRIGFGPDNNDMIFSDNSLARSYGGGLFFRVHDENTVHDYRDVMVMTDEGEVGIGTTEPGSRLHVHEKQNYGGQIKVSNTNSDSVWNIGVPGTAGSSEFMIYDYDESKTRLLINDAGNVGIGKTDPSMNLDVEGNVRFGNASRGIYHSILGGVGSPYGSSIGFNSYRDAAKASNILVSSTGSSNIKASSSINFDGQYNKMIFSFHKKANGLIPEDYNLLTNAKMLIEGDTGEVGIGTTAPDAKLQVEEVDPAKSIFSMIGDGGKCYFQIKTTCSSGWTQIGADDNQKLCMECND